MPWLPGLAGMVVITVVLDLGMATYPVDSAGQYRKAFRQCHHRSSILRTRTRYLNRLRSQSRRQVRGRYLATAKTKHKPGRVSAGPDQTWRQLPYWDQAAQSGPAQSQTVQLPPALL